MISEGFWKEEFSELITVLMKGSVAMNLESESPFPTFLPKIRCSVGTSSLCTAFTIFFPSIFAHQLEYHT